MHGDKLVLIAPNACFQPTCFHTITAVPFPLFLINEAPCATPHHIQHNSSHCLACCQLSPILPHRPYSRTFLVSLFLPAALWRGRDYWRKRAAFGAVLAGYPDPQTQHRDQREISLVDLSKGRCWSDMGTKLLVNLSIHNSWGSSMISARQERQTGEAAQFLVTGDLRCGGGYGEAWVTGLKRGQTMFL